MTELWKTAPDLSLQLLAWQGSQSSDLSLKFRCLLWKVNIILEQESLNLRQESHLCWLWWSWDKKHHKQNRTDQHSFCN